MRGDPNWLPFFFIFVGIVAIIRGGYLGIQYLRHWYIHRRQRLAHDGMDSYHFHDDDEKENDGGTGSSLN
jgi:hypothetical protein